MSFARLIIFITILFLGVAVGIFFFFQEVLNLFFDSRYVNGLLLFLTLLGVALSLFKVFSLHKSFLWLSVQEDKKKQLIYKKNLPGFLKSLKQWDSIADKFQQFSRYQSQHLYDEALIRLENNKAFIKYIISFIFLLSMAAIFWQLFITANYLTEIFISVDFSNLRKSLIAKDTVRNLLQGIKIVFATSWFGFFSFILLGVFELITGTVRRSFLLSFEVWLNKHTKADFLYPTPPFKDQETEDYRYLSLEPIVEMVDVLKNTIELEQLDNKEFKSTIHTLSDKLNALTEQMQLEQTLMMKVAHGQVVLKKHLEKMSKENSEGWSQNIYGSKEEIKQINYTLQQLVHFISSGGIVKEVKQELHALTKALRLVAQKGKKNYGNKE